MSEHWHMCPACWESYDCGCRSCENEEEVYCQECYRIAEGELE